MYSGLAVVLLLNGLVLRRTPKEELVWPPAASEQEVENASEKSTSAGKLPEEMKLPTVSVAVPPPASSGGSGTADEQQQ